MLDNRDFNTEARLKNEYVDDGYFQFINNNNNSKNKNNNNNIHILHIMLS